MSGSEVVELRRAQAEQVDEVARRPEGIADHVSGHRREGDDDGAVTLGEQHRLCRHRPVDELRQPADISHVGRSGGANGDLATLADLTCKGRRQLVGQPRYRRRRAASSIRESRPETTAPIPTRRMKTISAISMAASSLSRYYQHKSRFS